MSSPFSHYFNTNYVPSDHEIVTIRELISRGKMIMDDVKRRKEELQHEWRELKKSWEVQKREVEGHKALLSPIKRIPRDILSSIFLAAVEGRPDRPQRISARHPAVVISHVCQYWRNFAISTKLLWCNLYIEVPLCQSLRLHKLRWSAKVTKLVDMVQVWISRSDDCHLSVSLTDGITPGCGHYIEQSFSQGSEFDQLVDTLVASSSRWKSLKLNIFIPRTQLPSFPTIRLLTLPPQTTPILTELLLYCDVEESQDINLISQTLIAGSSILSTPTLRSLTIGPRTLFDIVRTPVVWSNLEHLDFGGYPSRSPHRFEVQAALTVLAECSNLVTCNLTLDDTTLPVAVVRRPIELPKLRKLVFLPYESHLPRGFAQSLILPSLRELEVKTGYSECTPRTHHESGLFEFCDRFGSTLERVTFCYLALTQQALLHCLKCLPNVTSLGLVSIGRLTPQVDVLPLCPKIRAFRFQAFQRDLAEEALLDFVAARRRGDRVMMASGFEGEA
ncbi:hypothetical protein MD484_g4884, partial [Candolleomyces efflorescens]